MTNWVTTDAIEAGRPWTLMRRSGSSALLPAQLIAGRSFFWGEEVEVRL
ncbi:hypothetical protein ACIBCL_10120 [Micromonospora zamorensis]